MSAHVTSADGTVIAYDRVGEGPTAILVAGATQHRANDPAATALAQSVAAKGCSAVTYDRRGRGKSTDTQPYAVDREVEDLAALVAAVGGEAVLLGSSSGAVLALWAAQAGIGVKALVMWEPPLTLEDDGAEFLASLQERIAARDRDGAIAVFMGGADQDLLQALRESPAYPAIWNVAHTLPYDAEVIASSLTVTPWSEQWDRVTVPTLVLTGEQTLDVFREAADALVAHLPHASQKRITNAQPQWRNEALTSVLVSALKQDGGCSWPCARCERERAAAVPPPRVDTSGPVPLYDA